jgi:PTH1 family peptidyl-tRNA hydrolase
MKLIVGLGNPGREYVGSRHNIGFEVVDRLAAKVGFIAKPADFDRQARSSFDGLLLDGPVLLGQGKQERLLLLKPTTFMNLSGKAVGVAKGFYQVATDDVIIIVDDLALPCGSIRMRADGSAGGHNGLRDVERVLGTHVYPRLRVGIDAKPVRMDQKDYVLGRFTEEQRKEVEPAIDRAAEALLLWARDGLTAASNVFNAKATTTPKPPKNES